MSYISLLIAWFKMLGASEQLTTNQWWSQYLDYLVIVEKWFFGASWVIVFIAFAGILLSIWFAIKVFDFSTPYLTLSCNCCLAIFLLLLPLWEWITLKLAIAMATSFDPVLGIVNVGKFWSSLMLFILIGIG